MNPITVQIIDDDCDMIVTRFLDISTTTTGTAEGIYQAMNAKLEELLCCPNPWTLCTSVGVDNTSLNIGVQESIKVKVLGQNPNIF